MPDRNEKQGPVQGFGEGYSYVAAGFTFAFAILGFGALGWLVDGWLHTRPLLAVILGLVGGFGAFMNLYYRVQREIEKEKREKGSPEGRGGKREM